VQWATLERSRIRYAVTGTGPALLLVMGIGGNLVMWRPLAAHFPNRQLIAFDAPGTGRSRIGRVRRMAGLADLAASLIDALGLDRVDVLGYSFGGALAQELAHRHPNRVSRLVLGATMCGLGGVPAQPEVYLHLSQPLRYFSARYLRWVSPRLYGGRARRSSRAATAAAVAAARLTNPPTLLGYTSQLWAISGWSSLPWLHTLSVPTLILAGDDDPIIPLINGRILNWALPAAELHVVQGGGHLFLFDQTADVIDAIEAFLRT
jgi:poly(3-hydroxyalkanoate) depolymerase